MFSYCLYSICIIFPMSLYDIVYIYLFIQPVIQVPVCFCGAMLSDAGISRNVSSSVEIWKFDLICFQSKYLSYLIIIISTQICKGKYISIYIYCLINYIKYRKNHTYVFVEELLN